MGRYEIFTSLGITEVLIATAVFIVTYKLITYYDKRKKNLPPGPTGLPVLGCLLQIRKDPHLKLQEMATKYGDVFSMYIGSKLVLVLNGVDAIKEGMNKPEFLARPVQGAFTFGEDIPSISTVSGKDFHDQRRFMLHSMRDLGLGKTVLEECMKVEIENFLRVLEDTKGRPYDLRTILAASMSNNITALIYGTRFDYDDPQRKFLQENQKILLEFIGQTAIHIFLPWISKVPFVRHFMGYNRGIKAFSESIDYNRKQIAEHKRTLDPQNTRDFIDKFLLEMEQAKKKKVEDTSFTDRMLIGNAGGLVGAGSETVYTTLSWLLFLMAVYEDVQKKVQDEISTVIGSEREPAWIDQREMPYTQSVIMEIMRWKTIVPINLLRYTYDDTTFRDYDIPSDTMVMANLWSAHYDTRYWKEPEKFQPERFLSTDGKSVKKSEAFMPFSVGRRSCPGETMAVVEVFIYFVTVLQKFAIKLPDGAVPDLDGNLTITLCPKPQKLRFISRSSQK